jgi:hypothetical protein
MPSASLKKRIKQQLRTIKNKRARVVIEHILKHGSITTDDLQAYGYKHPPRAARDVREAGIPLDTFRVQSSDGRRIAAYKFGDVTKIREGRLQGRRTFPKKLKDELFKLSDEKCATCASRFESRYLQIDHRVPYEVAGDENTGDLSTVDFMLLCGSCNRAKSWSCEHCANWLNDKRSSVCLTCYWADPDEYSHIALSEIRRADIVWAEDEVQAYERLKRLAKDAQVRMPEYVKKVIARHLDTTTSNE